MGNKRGIISRQCLSLTYLFGGNGLLAGLAELLNGLGVVAQILLAANEDDWDVTAEVKNLRVPLFWLSAN